MTAPIFFTLSREKDIFTIVVIYDIIDNKRRAFLKKLLNSFGNRIQRSAFECLLTREKYEILLKKSRKVCRRR